MNGSDEQSEADRQTAETNRIGAEGNRIGAETDRVTAATARDVDDRHAREGRRRKDLGQALAYVLIVSLAAFFFWQEGKQTDVICESARENREAIRNVVMAVDLLGTNLIVEGKPKSQWTEGEAEAMQDLEQFRNSQFDLLDAPVC